MSDDEVLLERHAGVAMITLNRPRRLNALTDDVMETLRDLVTAAAEDRAVRCVVLAGAGDAFCAGADTEWLAGRNRDPAFAERPLEERAAEIVRRMEVPLLLHEMGKPTIAMVPGVAAGGGLGLALACDLRIGSAQARFVTAFARMGLPGDFGGSYFLGRRCPAVAEELMFLSESIDAQRAQALGLLNRVVDARHLRSEVLALAGQLADGPTDAFAAMKRNLRLARPADIRLAFSQEAWSTVHATRSTEHKKAVAAFVERRKPKSDARDH